MTVVPGAITAALVCAVSLLMMFLALRRHLSDRRAALACAVLGFGTPVWTIAADATWPHTVTMLVICGLAWGMATSVGCWPACSGSSRCGDGCTLRWWSL